MLFVFEKYFERKRLSTTNFVMFLGLVENMYKVFLERFLYSCKSLFKFEQSSMNYLLYSKCLFFSSIPLDSSIILLVSRYP